jgi:hypothetical protein
MTKVTQPSTVVKPTTTEKCISRALSTLGIPEDRLVWSTRPSGYFDYMDSFAKVGNIVATVASSKYIQRVISLEDPVSDTVYLHAKVQTIDPEAPYVVYFDTVSLRKFRFMTPEEYAEQLAEYTKYRTKEGKQELTNIQHNFNWSKNRIKDNMRKHEKRLETVKQFLGNAVIYPTVHKL